MGNSWKYAQTLQFPQSDLCECGHYRKDHNNMSGFCIMCMSYGKVIDMTQPPADDVFKFLFGERGKSFINNDDCKKFRHWPIERVRRFWQIANIPLRSSTGTEQTILDDYLQKINEYSLQLV